MCKCAKEGPSATVLGHLPDSLPQAPNYPLLSVRLNFQPLSTLKQNSRNKLDVANDTRSILTNTPPTSSGIVAQIQAQSSH